MLNGCTQVAPLVGGMCEEGCDSKERHSVWERVFLALSILDDGNRAQELRPFSVSDINSYRVSVYKGIELCTCAVA